MSHRGFSHSSVGKESACTAGDRGSIPGSGRPPGEGNGNPVQYSWRIPWTEGPGGLQSVGSQELDPTVVDTPPRCLTRPPLLSSPRPPCVHRFALHVRVHLYSCWSSPDDRHSLQSRPPHLSQDQVEPVPPLCGHRGRDPRCRKETALGAHRLLQPLPSHPRLLLL